ncbi:MAG: hypothetical protein K1W23_11515 [Lachnospiraceae bacterium]
MEKQIEKTRENTRKKAEQISENIAERAEEAKKAEKEQDKTGIIVVRSDTNIIPKTDTTSFNIDICYQTVFDLY